MRISVILLAAALVVSACSEDSPSALDRPLNQVALESDAITIAQDDSVLINPGVVDGSGNVVDDPGQIWYEAEDADIADWDYEEDGPGAYIYGNSPGEAMIFVFYRGVDRDTITVTVTPVPAGSIVITPAALDLYVDDTEELSFAIEDENGNPLTRRGATFSSTDEDEEVIEVSEDGEVTAVGVGTAMVIASVDEVADTITVTVTLRPVETVTISPADGAALFVGDSAQFSAALEAANGSTLTDRDVAWMSSNTAVATVDANGKVMAVAPGSATITATSEGKSDSAPVVVVARP